MVQNTKSNNYQDLIRELINKIDPAAAVSIAPIVGSTINISVKAEDANILIGQAGETLLEIQHLIKTIINKTSKETVYIDLDINDYKKKKADYLKQLARISADEVSLTKRMKILAPMSAYETRIIHLELANREDIATESIGQGVSRKIIIKPRSF